MPTIEEGGSNRRLPRWRRAVDRLGPLSPFATLETFSPASRRLLAGAERDTERLLHLVRLVVVTVATVLGAFGFGLASLPPRFLVASILSLGLFAVFWLVVWRRLGRSEPSFGLVAA